MFFYIFLEVRYQKKIAKNPSAKNPEARLDPALIGSVLLPIGLFWFAWTTYNSIHWIVSILGGAVYGFGQVLLFISLINYVVDAYTVFAASALAANAILRGLFGAALSVISLTSQTTSLNQIHFFDLYFSITNYSTVPCSPPTCTITSAYNGHHRFPHSLRLSVYLYRFCSTDLATSYACTASTLPRRPVSLTKC